MLFFLWKFFFCVASLVRFVLALTFVSARCLTPLANLVMYFQLFVIRFLFSFYARMYIFFCFFRLSASLRSNFSFKIKCKCKRSLWLLYRIYRVACTTFCVLHIEHTCANADDVFSDFFSLSHIKWSKRRIEKI